MKLTVRAIGFAAALGCATSGAASPRIELYTMGRGDDLFSKFGHAALCVVDDELPGGGLCYNYGTADFSRPVGLGWDVVRGRAEFWVSVTDLITMLFSFESEERTIYRQRLPLDEKQVSRVAGRLAGDGSFENRAYIYNHFLENCSTRPRDHIDFATGGALRRARLPDVGTYRDYANDGLGSAHWALVPLGDFLMGRWVDRELSAFEAMFIPDVLREGVEVALGARPDTVFQRQRVLAESDVAGARARLWLAVVLFVASVAVGMRFAPRLALRLSGSMLGFFGSFLVLGVLVSTLPELRRNELLLVFLPFDFLLWSRDARLVRFYAGLRGLELAGVGVAAALGLLVQPLWPFWALAAGVIACVLLFGRI